MGTGVNAIYPRPKLNCPCPQLHIDNIDEWERISIKSMFVDKLMASEYHEKDR